MKRIAGAFLCLVPLAAYAQQTYTNEDLRKFSVPRAYTNQDLKKMAPVPVVGRPVPVAPLSAPVIGEDARILEARMGLLQEQRRIIQAELDWRNSEIEKAYSFIDKGPNGYPWPGYLSKSKGSLQYLSMQLAIVEDEARRTGVALENR